MSVDKNLVEYSAEACIKPVTEDKMEFMAQYHKLVELIKDIEREVKPMYAGNKNSAETVKKGLGSARMLARECYQLNLNLYKQNHC
ncbi:Cyclin-dependent kinase 2-associated protein 1 [Trichoplax sp. H2]|nr:Cyclin-dependent kinase 2-associated protein 1 [Trichoplax sp. H2]|eukprot:RDD40003.1 Cyclin-dependent kinase 2-associated protein 1 [Trichoplax sp. H2]